MIGAATKADVIPLSEPWKVIHCLLDILCKPDSEDEVQGIVQAEIDAVIGVHEAMVKCEIEKGKILFSLAWKAAVEKAPPEAFIFACQVPSEKLARDALTHFEEEELYRGRVVQCKPWSPTWPTGDITGKAFGSFLRACLEIYRLIGHYSYCDHHGNQVHQKGKADRLHIQWETVAGNLSLD